MEKKKFNVNTAICDARNVTEAVLESYESVEINAAVILVSEESKELMSRYDVNMNAAEVMEVPKDTEFMVQNGTYEITDSTLLSKPTFLVVNGSLDIKTSSQEVLDSFTSILVNGLVSYPSNIEDKLPPIKVNGSTESYPADAIKLKRKFIMDKTFILRSKNAKYFARNKVVIEDENLDIDSLVNKDVEFITKRAVIAEGLLEKALPLFGEEVEIDVIPSGYKYIGSQILKDVLIKKYGDRLYVDGDFSITLEGENALEKLSELKVKGTVYILERLKDKFYDINSEYSDLKTIKGIIMEDKPSVTLDKRKISKHQEGITVQDCGMVYLKDDISPDEIEEKLQFISCGCIFCNEEQKSAVQGVSEDVGVIDDSGKSKAGGLGALIEGSGILDKNTKVVNAASYTM